MKKIKLGIISSFLLGTLILTGCDKANIPKLDIVGTYGVAYPDSDLYTIVKTSMEIAQERIDNMNTDEPKAILRPWVQDFSAPWLKSQYGSNYVSYGPHQIREQKRAIKIYLEYSSLMVML